MDISNMVNQDRRPSNPPQTPSADVPQRGRMYGGTSMPLKSNPYSRRELVLNGGKPYELHPSLFTPQQPPPSPAADANPRFSLPSISSMLGYAECGPPGPPTVARPARNEPVSPVSPYGPPQAAPMMSGNPLGILPPTPPTRPESAFERHSLFGERFQEQPAYQPMEQFQLASQQSHDAAIGTFPSPLTAAQLETYREGPRPHQHQQQQQMLQTQQEQEMQRQNQELHRRNDMQRQYQELQRQVDENQRRQEYHAVAINNMDAMQQRQVPLTTQPRRRRSIPLHTTHYASSPFDSSSGNALAIIPYYSPVDTTNPRYQVMAQAFTPNGLVPVTIQPASGPWQQQHHHYIHASQAPFEQPVDRYICQTCRKAFSRPSSLRIHSHSHTGEKPYRCPRVDCRKAFSVRSNMKRHERGCHSASNPNSDDTATPGQAE